MLVFETASTANQPVWEQIRRIPFRPEHLSSAARVPKASLSLYRVATATPQRCKVVQGRGLVRRNSRQNAPTGRLKDGRKALSCPDFGQGVHSTTHFSALV